MNASRFKLPEQAGSLVGPDEQQEALDDRNKASRWQRTWRASSRTMIREQCTPGSTGGRGTLNKTEEIFSVSWAKEDGRDS
jgi:hypothetical protein